MPRSNKPRLYEYEGQTRSLCSIARMVGMDAGTLYARVVTHGMSLQEAIEQPVRARKKTGPKTSSLPALGCAQEAA